MSSAEFILIKSIITSILICDWTSFPADAIATPEIEAAKIAGEKSKNDDVLISGSKISDELTSSTNTGSSGGAIVNIQEGEEKIKLEQRSDPVAITLNPIPIQNVDDAQYQAQEGM